MYSQCTFSINCLSLFHENLSKLYYRNVHPRSKSLLLVLVELNGIYISFSGPVWIRWVWSRVTCCDGVCTRVLCRRCQQASEAAAEINSRRYHAGKVNFLRFCVCSIYPHSLATLNLLQHEGCAFVKTARICLFNGESFRWFAPLGTEHVEKCASPILFFRYSNFKKLLR